MRLVLTSLKVLSFFRRVMGSLLGYAIIPAPTERIDMDELDAVALKCSQEFGDVMVEYRDAMRDRNLTRDELERIELEIQVPPTFPEKYHPALIRSAEQCLVKRHFENPPQFDIHTEVVG